MCDKEVKTDLKKHKECGKLVQTHTINFPKNADIEYFMIMLLFTEKNLKKILMRLFSK